jgi:hypothetical protein
MNLAEYFALHRPKPKFEIGQRVIGKYEGVPFTGTCGCDNMVNETVGPMVTVFLDLPLKTKTTVHHTFIKVKYKDIRLLKEIELDSDKPDTKLKRKKV